LASEKRGWSEKLLHCNMSASIGKTLPTPDVFVQRNISSTSVGWTGSAEGDSVKNGVAP
jgi:hypothetical protein